MIAQANLCWLHSRKIPGVCIWQVSFLLGWKPSPAGAVLLIHPNLIPYLSAASPFWSGLMAKAPPRPSPESMTRICIHPKRSAGRTWKLLYILSDLQGKPHGYIRDHQKMNLWGTSVLFLASNAPKGAWRKYWHLPTSTIQILQSLFAASIHSFQGCFLWSCSSASHWRHKIERSQWIIRSLTAGLSKRLLLIFPLLLSFCSACNKSLCPLLFKLQPCYWKGSGVGNAGDCIVEK